MAAGARRREVRNPRSMAVVTLDGAASTYEELAAFMPPRSARAGREDI